jgi:hypothetical protein
MASPPPPIRFPHPSCPDDWVKLAQRELGNLKSAYDGKASNDAKVDHAVQAVEYMLKAVLWKQRRWNDWPKRTEKGFKFLYGHDLEMMLAQCDISFRISLRISREHWASWRVIANTQLKQARYSLSPLSDAEANGVSKAVRYPDTGVVPWLLKRYHEIT